MGVLEDDKKSGKLSAGTFICCTCNKTYHESELCYSNKIIIIRYINIAIIGYCFFVIAKQLFLCIDYLIDFTASSSIPLFKEPSAPEIDLLSFSLSGVLMIICIILAERIRKKKNCPNCSENKGV
jgi:hypothetical protein